MCVYWFCFAISFSIACPVLGNAFDDLFRDFMHLTSNPTKSMSYLFPEWKNLWTDWHIVDDKMCGVPFQWSCRWRTTEVLFGDAEQEISEIIGVVKKILAALTTDWMFDMSNDDCIYLDHRESLYYNFSRVLYFNCTHVRTLHTQFYIYITDYNSYIGKRTH